MTDKVLIDSDTLAYRAVVGKDDEPLDNVLDDLYNSCQQVLGELPECKFTQFYLTGSDNFRKTSYDWYKANRASTPRPVHLTEAKRFLEKEFGAVWSVNQEADDDIGIEVFREPNSKVLIAHIDKDLNQFPGTHYNYNKKEFYEVTETQAQQSFLHQMVLGDKVDNVQGFDGLIRPAYPKKFKYIEDTINSETDFLEGLRFVWDLYNHHGREHLFHDIADCLWLLKEPEKNWKKLEIKI